jgi:phosphatidylglycerol:prolipoprotein diacylglycerol transferase
VKPVPVEFHLGPLVVHTYGIGLAVTFWFAFRYFERRLRARGYRTDWVLGFFVWVIVAAVVGARVMHVLANLSYYRADPVQVFAVWHGGLSSWGGLLLAVPTGWLVVRRSCPELRLGAAMDVVAPVLAAGWAMGRLLGPQLMYAGGGHLTHQWFGMYYTGQAGKRLPVPIFQAVEDFAIFCVLLAVERRLERFRATRSAGTALGARPAGVVIGVGMVLWGIERVVDESLWLSYPGQLGDVLVEAAGVALAVAGVVVLVVARRRWRSWLTARLALDWTQPDGTGGASGPPRPEARRPSTSEVGAPFGGGGAPDPTGGAGRIGADRAQG